MAKLSLIGAGVALAISMCGPSIGLAQQSGTGNALDRINDNLQQRPGVPGLEVARERLLVSHCQSLGKLELQDAEVVSAQRVEATDNLPAFCEVSIQVRPAGYSTSPDSVIGIEVWLPEASEWNGKFQAIGNGGYSSNISRGALGNLLRQGYAAAGTDTGHTAPTCCS